MSRLSFRRKKLGIASLQDGNYISGKSDKQDLLNGNMDDTGEFIAYFIYLGQSGGVVARVPDSGAVGPGSILG